jgi:hypothetical protein
LEQYRTTPLKSLKQEIHTLMISYRKEWEEISLALRGLAGCDQELNIRLGEHSREWSARRCVSLRDDYQALQTGSDKFLVVYVDRWSSLYM